VPHRSAIEKRPGRLKDSRPERENRKNEGVILKNFIFLRKTLDKPGKTQYNIVINFGGT
jgi:hypothetical protein